MQCSPDFGTSAVRAGQALLAENVDQRHDLFAGRVDQAGVKMDGGGQILFSAAACSEAAWSR